MAKYKPLRPHELELNTDDVWIKALFSGAYGALDVVSDTETFFCRNCRTAGIQVKKGKPLPRVCMNCGEGIDWTGTYTKITTLVTLRVISIAC
jgi:hypothetical protein